MIPDELADALVLGRRPAMVMTDWAGRDVARVCYVVYADVWVVVVAVAVPGGARWEASVFRSGGHHGLRRAVEVAP